MKYYAEEQGRKKTAGVYKYFMLLIMMIIMPIMFDKLFMDNIFFVLILFDVQSSTCDNSKNQISTNQKY